MIFKWSVRFNRKAISRRRSTSSSAGVREHRKFQDADGRHRLGQDVHDGPHRRRA